MRVLIFILGKGEDDQSTENNNKTPWRDVR
jgi:hypothetical protein